MYQTILIPVDGSKRAESILSHVEHLIKGINAVTRIECGSVVKTILNVASETGADLIAVATHGFGGLARVSYGSVAAGILQAAEIPILLIRSCS